MRIIKFKTKKSCIYAHLSKIQRFENFASVFVYTCDFGESHIKNYNVSAIRFYNDNLVIVKWFNRQQHDYVVTSMTNSVFTFFSCQCILFIL